MKNHSFYCSTAYNSEMGEVISRSHVGGTSCPQHDCGVNEVQKGFQTSQNHKAIRKDRNVIQETRGRAEPGINCAQAWLYMPKAGKE